MYMACSADGMAQVTSISVLAGQTMKDKGKRENEGGE
jgi:hypothetical protein